MALRNAIPNPLEFIGQLHKGPGESWDQWFVAASFSLGAIFTFALFVLNLLTYAQLSFANFVENVFVPDFVPIAGGAPLFPFMTLATALIAVPVTFYMIDLGGNREQLYDDANGMLVFSGLTLIISSTQTAFDFTSLLGGVAVTVGSIWVLLYIIRVVTNVRRA